MPEKSADFSGLDRNSSEPYHKSIYLSLSNSRKHLSVQCSPMGDCLVVCWEKSAGGVVKGALTKVNHLHNMQLCIYIE